MSGSTGLRPWRAFCQSEVFSRSSSSPVIVELLTYPLALFFFTPMTSPKFKLMTGDCIEILSKTGPSCIDLVVTDPPYLVNSTDRAGRLVNDVESDWLEPAFEQISLVLKKDGFCVSFYDWSRAEEFLLVWKRVGLRPVGHLVWSKSYASNRTGFLRATHECAYLLAQGAPARPECWINDLLPWSYSGNELHPTQKPVSALEPLIGAFSKPGDTVLDPFSGSGSTGQAALLQDRDFLGIELKREYNVLARDRLTRFGTDRSGDW